MAIGSGCAGGVSSSSVLKNELDLGEDIEDLKGIILISGIVSGSMFSGVQAEMQAEAILIKNPKGVLAKYSFGTFMASVGSAFLCFEGWEYLESNRQNHGSKSGVTVHKNSSRVFKPS